MRFILTIFIFFSCLSTSLSQIDFYDFAIGDSIKKYYNQIKCAEIGLQDRQIIDDSCSSFQFLAAQQNPINIKQVSFPQVIFFIDKGKTIKSIYLTKSYLTTDSVDAKDQANADYKNLRYYIKHLTRSKGTEATSESSQNNSNAFKEITWKAHGFKYYLTKTQFVKRTTAQKLLFTVSLHVEQQDK